jgi:hypothetical protein
LAFCAHLGCASGLVISPDRDYLRVMVTTSLKTSGGAAAGLSPKKPKRVRVKIGGVFVSSDKASAAAVKRGVELSNTALERLTTTITKPGIKLGRRPGIPLYFADSGRPDRLVRKLNGKIELGVLEDGKFKVKD